MHSPGPLLAAISVEPAPEAAFDVGAQEVGLGNHVVDGPEELAQLGGVGQVAVNDHDRLGNNAEARIVARLVDDEDPIMVSLGRCARSLPGHSWNTVP